MLKHPHPKHFFHLGDALYENGSQLISNAGQQEAKQRNSKYGVQNAEDLSPLCAGGDVSITWGGEGEGGGRGGGSKEEARMGR